MKNGIALLALLQIGWMAPVVYSIFSWMNQTSRKRSLGFAIPLSMKGKKLVIATSMISFVSWQILFQLVGFEERQWAMLFVRCLFILAFCSMLVYVSKGKRMTKQQFRSHVLLFSGIGWFVLLVLFVLVNCRNDSHGQIDKTSQKEAEDNNINRFGVGRFTDSQALALQDQGNENDNAETRMALSSQYSQIDSDISGHHASQINQEMDRKLAAADLSPAYAEEMIATWRDRTNHEFVRNFAVQHLERYARECVVRGTWDPASADAADVRAALEEAVLETGTSVGGAALLALARLSEIDPHVDRTRLPPPTASPPPRSAASSASAPRFPPSAPSPPIPPPQRPSASPRSTRRSRSKAGERRLAPRAIAPRFAPDQY